MPVRYERVSVEFVGTTAETLAEIAESFIRIEKQMRQNGLNDAHFAWSQRQEDCLRIIRELARRCEEMLPAQLLAKIQNRPSIYEAIKLKSSRDMVTRELRNAGAPCRPVGRPRKVPKQTDSGDSTDRTC